MKKESLGDKYKKSLIRIHKLEEDKKALTERISKLRTLLVSMDILLGKRNVEIQKLKENIDKDAVFDECNENKIKYLKGRENV